MSTPSTKKRGEARRAAELIRQALESGKGTVSYQVAQEFFNVALRRFAKPMSAAEAEQYPGTVFRPLLTMHSSQSLVAEALRLASRRRLAWFDALIVASAVEGECSVLYTEDLPHGLEVGRLRVVNRFM